MTQVLVMLTLPHPFGCSSPSIRLLAERDNTSTQSFYLEVREIMHLIANVLKCHQIVAHDRELGVSLAKHL